MKLVFASSAHQKVASYQLWLIVDVNVSLLLVCILWDRGGCNILPSSKKTRGKPDTRNPQDDGLLLVLRGYLFPLLCYPSPILLEELPFHGNSFTSKD